MVIGPDDAVIPLMPAPLAGRVPPAFPEPLRSRRSGRVCLLCADQHGRQLSAGRGNLRAGLDEIGAPARARWRGTGLAFTRTQVACTVLARWEAGDKAPWLLLTELAPEASDAGWYGLRA